MKVHSINSNIAGMTTTHRMICLQVDCFDYDDDGDHDLIGSFSTTVEEMMKATSKPVRQRQAFDSKL